MRIVFIKGEAGDELRELTLRETPGFEVAVLHRSEVQSVAAVAGLLDAKPDAIVMPLSLPFGLSLYAAYRVHSLGSRTRLVLLTGSTAPEGELTALFDAVIRRTAMPYTMPPRITSVLNKPPARIGDAQELDAALRTVFLRETTFPKHPGVPDPFRELRDGWVLSGALTAASSSPSHRRECSVLFLASDPTDQGRLRLMQEYREISQRLMKSPQRDKVRLEAALSVRATDILEATLACSPDIVHFAGHGQVDGTLMFEGEDGTSWPVEPSALAALFGAMQRPVQCVLLNACYSAMQAMAIARQVPTVIGMKRAISDEGAIAYASSFYIAIGAGESPTRAHLLSIANMQLTTKLPEHETPVIVSP